MEKIIEINCQGTKTLPIESLKFFQGNLKDLSRIRFDQLKRSILKYGFRIPVFIWKNNLLDGHQRIYVVRKMIEDGYKLSGDIPIVEIPADNKKQAGEILLMINNKYGEITPEGLYDFLESMQIEFNNIKQDLNFPELDIDAFSMNYYPGDDQAREKEYEEHIKLSEKFIIPPFSVFDTRQGYWRERRNLWYSLGLKPEEGRGTNLLKFSETVQMKKKEYGKAYRTEHSFKHKEKIRKARGIYEDYHGTIKRYNNNSYTGTSVFDPVLCEVIYNWFNIKSGSILDPFAGESVKGIVAEKLGFKYSGIEIRQEQIDANIKNAKELNCMPEWIKGDSNDIKELIGDRKFDLCFTSPPYYNLEIYSDEDMSALGSYSEFMDQYKKIFSQCYDLLNDNRFLVVKIGEIRNQEKGDYRNFIGDNIQIFKDIGFQYYNEIILITAIGTLPIRINKQFQGYRKIGKTHQNILVFYKGNIKSIKKEYGDIKIASIKDQSKKDQGKNN